MMSHALRYASLGWRIFPLFEPVASPSGQAIGCSCPKGGSCGRDAGKHPRITDWPRAASADETTVRAWWSHWPTANIALCCDGDLLVVDVDPDGAATLTALEAEHEPLPATVEATTGRGRHLYLRTAVPLRARNGWISTTGRHAATGNA